MRATMILAATVAVGGLLVLVAPSYSAHATDYTFTTLDVPPGENNTAAYGVNDAGQIVGSFASGTGVHGFLYSGGVFTQIDVPGGTYTEAFGINNAGQIVGWYQVDGSGQFGFVDTGGSFSQIQFGPTYTIAHGINDPGAIVGYWNDVLGQHGFLLVDGTFTTLDATPPQGGSRFTRAYGVNNAGQISGTFFDGVGVHGFLYSGGVFTQIDAPGAEGSTQVFGVNDLGQMVGIGKGGFVDTGGSFSTLNVPGGGGTIPLGINHEGQVVGYFTSGADGLQHGFIATPVPVFAGAPGKANCYGNSVSALARQYAGLNAAAAALGYSGVRPLQNAILTFCGG